MPKDIKGWTQKKTWSHDRDKVMFPYFNEKNLETEGLLEIIRARAADPPSEFSSWDWHSWNKVLKAACGLIPSDRDPARVQDWYDLAARESSSYGEEFNTQKEAGELLGNPLHPLIIPVVRPFQQTHITDGHVPEVEAKLAIEVHQVVYQFLLGICKDLASEDGPKKKGKGKCKEPAQDEDEDEEDEDEEMPDADTARAMGEAVRALGTPWRDEKPDPSERQYQQKVLDYLETCRPGIPFTAPSDINWDFIEQVVHDRLVAAENELLGMRESPAVFAEKMSECRKNHWRQIAPTSKVRPGMSDITKAELKIWFGRTRGMTAEEKDDHKFHKGQRLQRRRINEKMHELHTAICQRIITYEIWGNCFRYVTELRENWDEVALYPREDSQVSADYQKLACMLWAHRAPGFTNAIPGSTIADEMAEIVERGKNQFSDLNKGFMADFRAANDVRMELGKFLLRHTDAFFKPPHSFIGCPEMQKIFNDSFGTPIKALFGAPILNVYFPSGTKMWQENAPPWQAVIDSSDKAEAPDYRQLTNYPPGVRQANQQAEANLQAFWTELDSMLEKLKTMPPETKALFERARPLRTPDAGVRPQGSTTPTTATSSSNNNTQDDTFVPFGSGTGEADRPSRLVLEDRQEKEKTRGVPDPSKEPARPAADGPAPPKQPIPVSKRAMGLLELLLGEHTENQPVAWDDFVAMMKSIGFGERTTKTGGSARLFVPTPKLVEGWQVAATASKHRPPPGDHHYLRSVRDWARNPQYGLAKYGWTLDSFVLQK
ncbi:uncharacterized protein PG986_011782 [Apiospora aurea]|uniref:Uncharacterized protein n=1 Tax=Apiospora aurea TaxID=335848 RepID=A0ABR1PYI5_9PEZI